MNSRYIKRRFSIFTGLLFTFCILLVSVLFIAAVRTATGGFVASFLGWIFSLEIVVLPVVFVTLCFTSLEIKYDSNNKVFIKRYRLLGQVIRTLKKEADSIDFLVKKHHRPEGDGDPTYTITIWVVRNEKKDRVLSGFESFWYGIKVLPRADF